MVFTPDEVVCEHGMCACSKCIHVHICVFSGENARSKCINACNLIFQGCSRLPSSVLRAILGTLPKQAGREWDAGKGGFERPEPRPEWGGRRFPPLRDPAARGSPRERPQLPPRYRSRSRSPSGYGFRDVHANPPTARRSPPAGRGSGCDPRPSPVPTSASLLSAHANTHIHTSLSSLPNPSCQMGW